MSARPGPRCSNPATWHPRLHVVEAHHHPPKAYRSVILAADPGADQSWWRLIDLCGICHSELHSLLNAYVHAAGTPAAAVVNAYSRYLRPLAAETWTRTDHSGAAHLPYTLTDGTPQGATT